jgi:hypothetical protein
MIATNALGHDRAVGRPEHGQRVRARWPRSSIAPRRALQCNEARLRTGLRQQSVRVEPGA